MNKNMNRKNKSKIWRKILIFVTCMAALSVNGVAAEPLRSEKTQIQEETAVQSEMPVQEETAVQSEMPVQKETAVQSEMPVQKETIIQNEMPAQEETEAPGEVPVQEETQVMEKKTDNQKKARAADIAVNETNFPDPVFREYVLEYLAGDDGVLSEKERAAVQYMELYYEEELKSVKGIEYFPNLQYLYLEGSKSLKSLDLRSMKNLKELHCDDGALTSLKVNGLSNLKKMFCSQNDLKTLNLSGVTALEQLECSANALTALNVKKLPELKYLICRENQIRTLDLSGMSKLEKADCEGNGMTSLKLGNNSRFTTLLCGTNSLTVLELSGLPALATLYCYQNQLKTLNCAANTQLAELEAFQNQLKTLELGGLKNLVTVNCSENKISMLDVASAAKLTSLIADNNAIPALNLSANKKLQQASFQNQVVTTAIVQTETGYQTDFSANGFKKKSVINIKDAKTCKTGLFWKTQTEIPAGRSVSYTYKTGRGQIVIPVTVKISGIRKWNPKPKKVKISYAGNVKGRKLSLKWQKLSGVTGYQICYGTSSKFSRKKTKKLTVKKASAGSRLIKGLKKNRTYYVRIRAYKKYKGKIYYGAYSSKKKIKIRK